MTTMSVSGWMFLLVPAHPGCPGQIPESHKTVVCVCVCVCVCVLYLKHYWFHFFPDTVHTGSRHLMSDQGSPVFFRNILCLVSFNGLLRYTYVIPCWICWWMFNDVCVNRMPLISVRRCYMKTGSSSGRSVVYWNSSCQSRKQRTMGMWCMKSFCLIILCEVCGTEVQELTWLLCCYLIPSFFECC